MKRFPMQGMDFHHKISKTLADENQAVGAEDVNIKGVQKNRKLAQFISDASWKGFLNKLKYKLVQQGKHLVQIWEIYSFK